MFSGGMVSMNGGIIITRMPDDGWYDNDSDLQLPIMR